MLKTPSVPSTSSVIDILADRIGGSDRASEVTTMGNFGSRGGLRHVVPVMREEASQAMDATLDRTLASEAVRVPNEVEPFIELRRKECPELITGLARAGKSCIDDHG